MESTPLILVRRPWYLFLQSKTDNFQAHSHARNAAVETHKANPTAASEEHDLAAGEFANAAKSTGDAEVSYESLVLQYGLTHS